MCSICLVRLPSKDEWSIQLLACGLEDMSKRKFECEFVKKTILTRHIKRVHCDDQVRTATKNLVQSTPKGVGEDEDCGKERRELIFDIFYIYPIREKLLYHSFIQVELEEK